MGAEIRVGVNFLAAMLAKDLVAKTLSRGFRDRLYGVACDLGRGAGEIAKILLVFALDVFGGFCPHLRKLGRETDHEAACGAEKSEGRHQTADHELV